MEPDVKEQLDSILSQYSGQSSDLIPILQEAQERFGYLPREVMQGIARFLRLPESTVYGVATFYAQLRLIPKGKKIVKVCQGPACHVRGGRRILPEVEGQLGIKLGKTPDDQEYSLETTTCPGLCALAPVMEINGNIYRNMTATKLRNILADIK